MVTVTFFHAHKVPQASSCSTKCIELPRTSSSSSPEKPGHNREAKEKKDPERLERSPKTAEGSRHRTERSPEKKVEGLRNKAKAEYTQNKVEHSKVQYPPILYNILVFCLYHFCFH